jgi:hypothetical protein
LKKTIFSAATKDSEPAGQCLAPETFGKLPALLPEKLSFLYHTDLPTRIGGVFGCGHFPKCRLLIPNPQFLALNNVYLRRTLTSPQELRTMPDEEWIKTLEDGRKVKFFYQELPEDGAFISAQIEGNEVVYSVILTKARNPLSPEDVESHFKGELSKK